LAVDWYFKGQLAEFKCSSLKVGLGSLLVYHIVRTLEAVPQRNLGFSNSTNMIRKLNLGLALLVIYICGQCTSVRFNRVQSPDRYLPYYDHTLQEVLEPEGHILRPLAAAEPHNGTRLLKPTTAGAKWIATCDNDPNDNNCLKVIDGNINTSWNSKASATTPFLHEVIIDLRTSKKVNGVRMDPGPRATTGGAIVDHEVFLAKTKGPWGDSVAFGTWFADKTGICDGIVQKQMKADHFHSEIRHL
jgi:hypothetical protein